MTEDGVAVHLHGCKNVVSLEISFFDDLIFLFLCVLQHMIGSRQLCFKRTQFCSRLSELF